MEIYWLSDEIAYSEQPRFADLPALDASRIHTLVDVRLPHERPTGAAGAAARHGLRYVHVSVPAVKDLTVEALEAVAKKLASPDALPALVYSGEGARAAIVALAWLCVEKGRDVAFLEAAAQRLGLDVPDAAREFVRRGAGVQPGAT